MDQQKLRTLVFEKTGVRIDVDDPVFALVALNEAVLAEAVERHVALLHEASAELAAQVAALHGRPATAPSGAAAGVRAGGAAAPAARGAPVRAATIGAGCAVLGALLVLGGEALLFRNPPAALPVAQAPAPALSLSPEQSAAVQHAEKLARVVERLDRKTRATIAAEMQKP
jgi:hypothetical protein